jgi:Co/Zn/Cd efflux system component
MMALEIVGGVLSGSLALIADGLHMSTHAGALLLAALAYGYARRHVGDRRFSFGTGKLGDLAGFTSAVIRAMIALFIGYEAVSHMRAAIGHVAADAAVSVLVILGLVLAQSLGWRWMDPLAGIVGAVVDCELVVWPDARHRERAA